MSEDITKPEYWEQRYHENKTGWDIGYASTPLIEYFNTINDKSIKILIPGCGNAYEAAVLYKSGFKNIFVIDLAKTPLEEFQKRHPDFPAAQLIHGDFFKHNVQYDVIVEQTFFCALPPKMRTAYAEHMLKVLKPDGKLLGVFFNIDFKGGPPFGGNKAEYEELFSKYFEIQVLEEAHNSIKPRLGSELFAIFKKP